jgi:hypothetical protein
MENMLENTLGTRGKILIFCDLLFTKYGNSRRNILFLHPKSWIQRYFEITKEQVYRQQNNGLETLTWIKFKL